MEALESQEPDWAGIRAASVAVGVREAARQAARHLTEAERERFVFRVLKRSQREGWVTATKSAQDAAQPLGKPMSSIVLTGSDVVKDTLADGAKRTKLGLTRYTARMAEQVAASGTLEDAPLIKAVADIHSKMHPEEGSEDRVALQFFSITMNQGEEREEKPVVDV